MSKKWKVFWIVCAVISAVGLVCCAAASAMGVTAERIESRLPNGVVIGPLHGGNEKCLSAHDENGFCEEDRADSYPGVTNLDVDMYAGQVEVVSSTEVQSVEVKTEGISQKSGLKYYREGDTLHIISRKKHHHFNGGGVGTITITVPMELRWNEAKFEMGAGTLNIEAINAEELNIDMGSGEANIDHFEAEEMDLDCGAGEITGIGTVIRELDTDCGVGNIQLHLFGKETDYNYEIDCGVGKVQCGENSYSGLGTDRKIDNHASGNINIDCGVGNVALDFADSL